jgi:predicted  nucleic acid-binding Zn-ribbon protein
MANKPEEQKAQPPGGLAEGVLVQVCVECGQHYFFDDSQPPPDQKCERCGNTVFRSFFDVTSADEVETDYREATERDVTPEEPATDVTRGDLYDLNNP